MHPIYEHIKKLRLANKYSQEYMANQIGMEQSNYGKLENGKIQITIERLEKIAEVFGMTVVELLAGHEQGTQRNTDLETLERLENRIKELERENSLLEREKEVLEKEKEMLGKQKKILETEKEMLEKDLKFADESLILSKKIMEENDYPLTIDPFLEYFFDESDNLRQKREATERLSKYLRPKTN